MSSKATGSAAASRDHPAWVVPMVLGEVVMALHAGSLGTPAGLAWFILGSLVVVLAGMRVFPRAVAAVLVWMAAQRAKLAAAVAAAVAVALLVWLAAPPAVAYGVVLWFGCEHPTELRVLTPPDDVDTYRDVAEAFVRDTAGVGGCPTTHVHVYGVEPATAADAVAVGWHDEQLLRHGGRPDVLVTASRGEADHLRALLGTAASGFPQLGATEAVAWTPLVLGVPAALAHRLDEAGPRKATWHDLLREARSARIGVARPYPTGSGTGLLAADALLSTPEGGLVPVAEARRTVRWADSSAKAAGLPLDTAVGLLRAHRESPGAAVIVPEQALARSNLLAGTADGVRRPCAGASAPPACLIARYPADTYRVWHSVTPLRWSPGAPAHEAALAFTAWLGGAAGQEALWRTGLRTDGQTGSDLLTQRNGTLAGPQTAMMRGEPSAQRRLAVDELQRQAQRPGRVLLALDASGSMRTEAAPERTRMQVAVAGVHGALGQLGPEDTVGLWTFSGRGVAEVIAFSPRDDAKRLADARLPAIRPEGSTPLFPAVRDGVAAVAAGDANRVSALVVLTDGEDTSGTSAAELVAAVRDEGVRVFVVAIGEAACAGRAVTELTKRTHGACVDASPSSVDHALTDLFRRLWG